MGTLYLIPSCIQEHIEEKCFIIHHTCTKVFCLHDHIVFKQSDHQAFYFPLESFYMFGNHECSIREYQSDLANNNWIYTS